MTIGQRIHNIRKEKNLSLRGLASKAEISVAYLTKIEKDESSPTIEVLERFADAFNMTVHELTAVVEEAPPKLAMPESLSAFIESYQDKFAELKDADWQRTLAQVRLRGQYPKHAEDWLPIFASVRRALGEKD